MKIFFLVIIFSFSLGMINCASQNVNTTNSHITNDPFLEFESGKISVFSTKDLPKAKGINFSIEYPKSWVSKDSANPEILQTLVNPNLPSTKADAVDIYLMEMPGSNGIVITEDYLKKNLSQLDMKSFFPNYVKLISTKTSTVSGFPALIIEGKIPDNIINQYGLSHYRLIALFVGTESFIVLRFSNLESHGELGDLGNELEFANHLKSVMPLFKAMEKSILISSSASPTAGVK